MRVCVVGAGGREHALADALSRTAEVVCLPGNPGMEAIAECSDRPVETVDAELYVVGPEGPLVDGLADRLRAQGRTVLGPGADGARLEGSKAWMKEVLGAAGVATAAHGVFASGQLDAALAFLGALRPPWVVKTDGLAAGKGVLVTTDLREAAADVRAKLSGAAFGAAGRTIVIEEGLRGPELSVLALCDGRRAVALPAAQDFKRLREGDRGPNTGGMGAYSPVAAGSDDLVAEVMERAVAPTLACLRARGIDYRGILYAGLMLTPDGPRMLEYNVRFGDPEAQVVLPRVDDDLPAWLLAAADGGLPAGEAPRVTPEACVTVVMASAGYPGAPRAGDPITGIEEAGRVPGVLVFHAGTAHAGEGHRRDGPGYAPARGPDGRGHSPGRGGDGLVTSGGRVLAVTGRGGDVAAARAAAYAGIAQIAFDGAQVRPDIAAAAAGPAGYAGAAQSEPQGA